MSTKSVVRRAPRGIQVALRAIQIIAFAVGVVASAAWLMYLIVASVFPGVWWPS